MYLKVASLNLITALTLAVIKSAELSKQIFFLSKNKTEFKGLFLTPVFLRQSYMVIQIRVLRGLGYTDPRPKNVLEINPKPDPNPTAYFNAIMHILMKLYKKYSALNIWYQIYLYCLKIYTHMYMHTFILNM